MIKVMKLSQMKLLKKLIFNCAQILFLTIQFASSNEIIIKSIEEIDKYNNSVLKYSLRVANSLKLKEDKIYSDNLTFIFNENVQIIIPQNTKLIINGHLKANSKIFHFLDNQSYKNLYLNYNEFFDVRWFDNIEISQNFSSFHKKTMYFDDYKIDGNLSFTRSNITAYFNDTILTGTFHFSEQNNCNQNTILKNINIKGIINIYGRLGGYCGENIFIDTANLINNKNYRPAGVHIYSNIKNLKINNLYIEDSIRHNALGIDSANLDDMPENIYIDNIYIENSYVHGAFINGININIGKLFINDFGNIRKSKFDNTLHRGLNFPFYFKYLDLFENSPKGLIIGYGSGIKINDVVIKTNNYSIFDFFNYFRIKKFLVQPSLFFVDLTNNAKIDRLDIEIPATIKFANKVIEFIKNKVFIKLIDNTDQNQYRVNNTYSNIWPFEFLDID